MLIVDGARDEGASRRPNLLLRQRRLLKGWSQQEQADQLLRVADATGIRGLRCGANDVGRWERGERRPTWPYTQLLCLLHQTTADQLGLVVSLEEAEGGRIDNVERRDLFKYGLGLAASAALVDWERLAAAGAGPRYLDGSIISDLQELTWEFGRRSHSMAPASLLPTTQHHLLRIQQLARDVPAGDQHEQLVNLLGETAVVAGRLSYQLDNRGYAEALYGLAERCGIEADDPTLRAQAYIGLSYLCSTVARGGAESDRRALRLLDHAVATGAGLPVLRAWTYARRAEEHAARQDRSAAEKDLYAAQTALDETSGEERGLLSQWGQPWLDGYRANVYLLVRQPGLAEEVNTAALRRLDPSLLYQRSALLSDIARAQAEQGDVDRACATLEEALDLARRQGVEVRLQHVRRARERMGGDLDSAALRRLDEKLQLIA
jgi:transcriptional regulator with XRE-family HTH domain